MKDPDVLHDAIQEAVSHALKEQVELGYITEDEKDELRDIREEKIGKLASKWFEYGEYLTVEIDTHSGTIRVCEVD